ncbi:MAG: tetratricopeptide repeat protein [Betaproteobacteria bacterium]
MPRLDHRSNQQRVSGMKLRSAAQTSAALTPADEREEEPLSELTLPEALSVAMQLHRAGQLDEGETVYRRILEVAPDYPDALHYLGVLTHQRGRSVDAIELIEKSIALDPTQPDRYNNLGNVLVELGRLPEAANAYGEAVALQPEHADAYNNLGAVLKAQSRFKEAAEAFQKAIDLNPEHINAYNNLGNLLSARGMVKEAVAYYCKAITLMPNHPQSRKLLGIAYYSIGQVEAAANVFREWLRDEPNHPVAQHMFSACSGHDVPARASDAYVEATFDSFAGSFDEKLGRLEYRAPQLIAEALAKACAAPAKNLIALDAGCGTGLCGPLIAPYVSHLVGVDLSAGMLAKAQGRALYDDLVKAELTAYLQSKLDAFDLIVSADTLVYFGRLEPVIEAAARALRNQGLLIFTVEETADADAEHRINPHGRYSHSRAYVERTLSAAGLEVRAIESAALRMEGGNPVTGLVVTAAKM